MTTPISNNNPGGVANKQAGRPEERESRGQAPAAQTQQVHGRQDDALTVSRAAEMLSQGSAPRAQGVIQSAEQAAHVAQQLKAHIQADPGAALAGQAQGLSSEMLELLKAG
ncbi:hypothetical protein Tel_07450 [Candidatus Tenderia electrophaga]|uniref:Uncharacterized protein n=1 Tax=Candidatus Tenderia electrophaga TaxID=1748243 RepID=A0A0S2TCW6_9GAMM|nr:hypothetical protein Tel_07450 [Candidatus Tenderia electrophaga]